MIDFTTPQWIAFTGITVAGIAGLILIGLAVSAYRTWTAPAPLRRAPAPILRPTILAASRRAPLPALTGEYTIVDTGAWDPQSAAATAAIEGGPAAIAATPPDPTLLTTAERAAAEAAWITSTAVEVGPVLDAVLRDFRAAVEPAMRKARLWELQGQSSHRGGAAARVQLDHWRIDTPTGEYRMVPAVA